MDRPPATAGEQVQVLQDAMNVQTLVALFREQSRHVEHLEATFRVVIATISNDQRELRELLQRNEGLLELLEDALQTPARREVNP